MQHYTAVVIGSGPAGHTCAVRLAQLGARVAVIESDFVGGICTNWGCTPSKSMIESAKIARVVRESGRYGVRVPQFSVDFRAVAERRVVGWQLSTSLRTKSLLISHDHMPGGERMTPRASSGSSAVRPSM